MSLAVKAARMQAAGDPGLFGSIGKFLGGGLKLVSKIAPGPLGFAAGLGARAFGVNGGPQIQPPAPTFRRGGVRPLFGPGTQPFVGPPVSRAQPGVAPGTTLACPAGEHPNKSAYFLKSGQFVPKGTRCVPSRRRNPGNSRANDRAIGRIESAKKMAARLGRITIRKECPGK